MTTGWGPNNPFFEGLETDPEGQRANYFSFQDSFGGGNRKKYFAEQFSAITDQFLGHIGGLVAGDTVPDADDTLRSHYANYFAKGGGADQEWYGMSPSQRGEGTGRFAPPVRWLS